MGLILGVASFSHAGSRVVVEAAHGGSDAGSRANGQSEKDWTLQFAKAVKTALEAAGVDVVLVRGKDEALTDDQRSERANTVGAAAAIVIHADRETTGAVQGPFVVVHPPMPATGREDGLPEAGRVSPGRFKQSRRLAGLLAVRLGVSDKPSPLSDSRVLAGDPPQAAGRILGAPHRSLRFMALPAVVVEPLFLSNKADLKKFDSQAAVDTFAKSLAQGVLDYLSDDGGRP